MEVQTILEFMALAVILGILGQGARSVIGLKKAMDAAPSGDSSWFDARRLAVSMIIGAIAGGLAGLGFVIGGTNESSILSGATLVSIVAAGYAGADFIEGFMRSRMPQYEAPQGDGKTPVSNRAAAGGGK